MANAEHLKMLETGAYPWNDWRLENLNITPDLSGANFSHMDLSHVDFSNTNLSKASFSRTNLSQAYLKNANFERARFFDVDFWDANLDGANLTYTEFQENNVRSLSLQGANFQGSVFYRNQFCDVDLSSVKGLDLVKHDGPSSIDIETIFRSQGQISEVFLRGCGVPEEFISYVPSLTSKPVQFYSCFISYSHADKDFAHSLYDFLQERGIRCWLDAHQVPVGGEILEELDRGIKLWDKVILCASENSLTSYWVGEEIDRAIAKEARLMKERKKKVLALIPLNLDGYMFSGWQSAKAETLKTRLAGNFIGWKRNKAKMHQEFESVLRALRTDGGREEPPLPRL